MTKKVARWFLSSLLAILGILALATPVLAAVPQPTSLEIREIAAYENARETGDQLYIVTYYITENATQNIDQLFIFRILENDVELDSKTAFPFHDQGFGLGIVSFYFAPDDAPTWEGNVSVQIVGNPLVDWDGDVPSLESDFVIWDTGTTTEVQQDISAKILYLATQLGQLWEIDLVATAQGIMSLTSAGAAYFLTVVPYAVDMVPYIFGSYVYEPDYPIDEKPPADNYADELTESILHTVFDLRPTAREWGISRGALTTAVWYIFVVGLFILLIQKRKLNRGTMLLFWPFVVAGAFFGVPLEVTIIAGFFCLISTVWVFYKGTT